MKRLMQNINRFGLPFLDHGSRRASLADRPLSSAFDLGLLLAAFKVTSPHTIPPGLSGEVLCAFAAEHGIAFGGGLPFKFPSAQVGVRVMEELYPEFIKAEYEKAGAKLAYWSVTNNYFLVATRKPVKTLADLKGMKIRSGGGLQVTVQLPAK